MNILIGITIFCYVAGSCGYILFFIFQKDRLHRVASCMMLAGFATQTAMVVLGAFMSGQLPVQNLRETLFFAAWTIVGLFFALRVIYHIKVLGVFVALLAASAVTWAAFLSPVSGQFGQLFNSIWLVIHITATFIGDAAFALACGVSILYLLQERAIKAKNAGFCYRRLPSLELLDGIGYLCITIGFATLSLGLITGLVYAKSIWGRFWSWDPKEVWSAITWLLYAILLHQRLSAGWRGRRAAQMAIIGFGVILFTFLGVNFLLKGHHGIFTGQG